MPTKERSALIQAGQSPTLYESLASVSPPWSSSRTCLPGLLVDTSEELERNYRDWVTSSKSLSSSVRRTLARRIGENGFLLWPTARARKKYQAGEYGDNSGPPSMNSLNFAATMWPTACASPEAPNMNSNTVNGPTSLGEASTMWPTADGSISQDGETPETWLARRKKLKETADNGNGCGTPLAMASQLWATPCGTDGKRGNELPEKSKNRKRGKPKILNYDAIQWASPAARDWKSGEASEEILSRNARPLNEQALMFPCSLPDPEPGDTSALAHTAVTLPFLLIETLPDGSKCLNIDQTLPRRLNTKFVRWLMGQGASINCADSETQSCRLVRRLLS
jgi:hypothetical protein